MTCSAIDPLPDDLDPALANEVRRKTEDLIEAFSRSGVSFPNHPFVRNTLAAVFLASHFVSNACIREPLLLSDLVESGDLMTSYLPGRYHRLLSDRIWGVSTEAELSAVLRCFRKREMVRIAWRDIAGAADLIETMTDLTHLAEACLDLAIAVLYGWMCRDVGVPVGVDGSVQKLVVIGMGKLGAAELNFSSDIDLIFAYVQNGYTRSSNPSQPVSNEMFFQKLCRKLIGVFHAGDAEGPVFRIDLNLRPFGENGPLVMGFDAMEDYYQRQGREWERYAWIKARPVAGDILSGYRLLEMLRPFVYRRYLDYGVFDALREMKQRIAREVLRKGLSRNIKLGAGGIREIEFFGQVFQLIRGGVSAVFQTPSILVVLRLLAKHRMISEHVHRDLERAYRFLRMLEHRLQETLDRQIHVVPMEVLERKRLARSLGYRDEAAFDADLVTHTATVHRHFHTLLETALFDDVVAGSGWEAVAKSIWLEEAEPAAVDEALRNLGYTDTNRVRVVLSGIREDNAIRSLSLEGRKRLDRLMPLVIGYVAKAPEPELLLDRIGDMLRAIGRRSSYFALMAQNPHTLDQIIRLASASTLIVNLLARHPVLLDELLDTRLLYAPPRKAELQQEIRQKMLAASDQDIEQLIERLCIFKQSNVFRVAAADVTGVLPLMRVSDHLTEIAEVVIDEVLMLAWQAIAEKFGAPDTGKTPLVGKDFLVVGYGKLGGLELGYASDLDLVFLHGAQPGMTTGGRQSIDHAQFYMRLAQRIVYLLTTRTRAGQLYDADTRLRPDGESGILVSSMDGFLHYQMEKAWTWEHQALVRARPVSGDPVLADRFQDVRREILAKPRDPETLRRSVIHMRSRLLENHPRSDPEMFDLKNDRGGIIDIEFIVQYLLLLGSSRDSRLLEWSDNVRQLTTLIEAGIMAENHAYFLKEAYLTYRATMHQLSLQQKPPVVGAKRFESLRKGVLVMWKKVFRGKKG
uniref:Bifunctional [glutamate--ammonia ligase]-adenylyl-L-tyrosine phosphorylase/[glutamate--ammonia-ligase] adenylyltransferase n=1 Tax=Desulfatirhabdium butyrativorans TaxID=340467 RepID=A0A7C4RTT2_9BACT